MCESYNLLDSWLLDHVLNNTNNFYCSNIIIENVDSIKEELKKISFKPIV